MDRKRVFSYGQQVLAKITPSAYQEALILLSVVLGLAPTHVLSHLECGISDVDAKAFLSLIKRRSQGEPLAYLKGECEFWSALFHVTPDCLIPRQDTELLVEQLLAHYASGMRLNVLELGTGSGAIAITLSLERPGWEITATDQSVEALKVAEYNAHRLGATVRFRQGDWFKALELDTLHRLDGLDNLDKQQRFDVIISNPPYVSEHDPHLSSLRYEPEMALVGGEKGTEALYHLIQEAPGYLKPGGCLWLEQGFDQAEMVKCYLEQKGYQGIQQYRDLQGIVRVSRGMCPVFAV